MIGNYYGARHDPNVARTVKNMVNEVANHMCRNSSSNPSTDNEATRHAAKVTLLSNALERIIGAIIWEGNVNSVCMEQARLVEDAFGDNRFNGGFIQTGFNVTRAVTKKDKDAMNLVLTAVAKYNEAIAKLSAMNNMDVSVFEVQMAS